MKTQREEGSVCKELDSPGWADSVANPSGDSFCTILNLIHVLSNQATTEFVK